MPDSRLAPGTKDPPDVQTRSDAGARLFLDGCWLAVKDGDRRALRLFERHYSCRSYKDGRQRTLFVGPGEKLVLLTRAADALFVWRKFRSMDYQDGVNCAVFRNESRVLSSTLIREACTLAWRRWPNERFYTYVDPRRVRSVNPGCCFRAAGWRVCGQTKRRKLVILELLSDGLGRLPASEPSQVIPAERSIPERRHALRPRAAR